VVANSDWYPPSGEKWAPANGRASAKLACSRAPGGFGITASGDFRAYAGWGGVQGNYREATASISGTAKTGFNVEQVNKYCLTVDKYDIAGERKRAYPGSYKFQEGSYTPALLKIVSPQGNSVPLEVGKPSLLDQKGLWQLMANFDGLSAWSNWAENSGRYSFSNVLVFRFVQASRGGKCLM